MAIVSEVKIRSSNLVTTSVKHAYGTIWLPQGIQDGFTCVYFGRALVWAGVNVSHIDYFLQLPLVSIHPVFIPNH